MADRPLKVLFVTDTSRIGISYPLVQAFIDAGHQVTTIPLFLVDEAGDRISIQDPALRALDQAGETPDVTGANEAMLAALEKEHYDILWVIKGLPIRPDKLSRAKILQPLLRLVYSSEDDMFMKHNQSRWLLDCLPQFDAVFTTKSRNTAPDELPALGCRNVIFIDNSYCPHRYRPLAVTRAEHEILGTRVGFIGRFEQARADSMLYLARNGIEVRVWGHTWPKEWRKMHRLLVVKGKKLIGDDYTKAICSTDINLGFLRKINRDTQTVRTMEITASGGFLLAERTDEHRRLFEEGKEAAYFSSDSELLSKVRHYLTHPGDLKRIAAASRERCLGSGYSYGARLPEMLRHVMV
jgi:spore maturation protein CgeB